MSDRHKPAVLFVCVKNGGKSQMAAGLMRHVAGDTIDIYSAGTKPGTAINALSAEALREVSPSSPLNGRANMQVPRCRTT